MRSKLRRWARELVILLLMVIATVWGMDQLRKPVLPAGFSATSVETMEGAQMNIAALSEERPLLIYVWATWCAICRYTTPAVERLTQEGGNVLSVALRSGDDGQLSRWMAKKRLTMPVVNDASGALSRQWQVSVTPTLVIVSKGNVVGSTTGWSSYWGMKLRLWWAGR